MAVLCIFLAIACVFDYGRGKIPNLLVGLVGVTGIVGNFIEGSPGTVLGYLIRAGCMMILTYPFFRLGMLGAGDSKLLSVAAGYFAVNEIVCFFFFSMFIAAIISIFRIVKEHSAGERLQYFWEYCADVVRTGNWKLYFADAEVKYTGVCLSGPILFSAVLHWGGVY